MIIRDFKLQFHATKEISERFILLMQKSFVFYSDLSTQFFETLSSQIQSGSLTDYLQNELRKQLFDPSYCETLEAKKKEILTETIKLDEFKKDTKYQIEFLNDLSLLKTISEQVYQLLEKHWEFFKYQKSAMNQRLLVDFLLEIDRISISWDIYLEKYTTINKLLELTGKNTERENFKNIEIKYHLPEGEKINLQILTNFVQFLQLAYEFILTIYKADKEKECLEIDSIEAINPIYCQFWVPTMYSDSLKRFLKYLSVDVIKKETLLKFVMEILRLQKGSEIPKPVITSYQKKISKYLELLHPQGFLSIDEKKLEDSVSILTEFCSEMDQLKIKYKDLLTGSTNQLLRNRMLQRTEPSTTDRKTQKSIQKKSNTKVTKNEKNISQNSPNISLNLKEKEHIGFLTS